MRFINIFSALSHFRLGTILKLYRHGDVNPDIILDILDMVMWHRCRLFLFLTAALE